MDENSASQTQLQAIIASATDVIITIDASSTIQFASDAVESVFGYAPAEVEGEPLTMLMSERYRPRHLAAIEEYLGTGERNLNWNEVELPGRHRDGHEIPLSISFSEFVQNGERFFTGIIRDVSDREEHLRALQQREEEIERTREQMEYALEITDSVIYVVDLDTGESTEHGPVERLFGTIPAGITDFLEEVVHAEDRPAMDELFDAIRAGDKEIFDVKFRTGAPEAEATWIRSRGYVRGGEAGEPDLLIGLVSDITEQKRREEELRRQNERLDKFASVVSHDLRNPLNVAMGRLELAREQHDSEELDSIARAHDRMGELIDDLLKLAREGREIGTLEPINLEEMAEQCWRNVETSGERLEVKTDRPLRVDPSRFQELIENLYRNAIEHGGDGVSVTVGPLEDGFYVEDNGPGIPEDERDKVFETGYSTSEQGMGFGLSIVREIALAHDWKLSLTDGVEGGARFEFTGVES